MEDSAENGPSNRLSAGKLRIVPLILTLAISGFALWFAFRGTGLDSLIDELGKTRPSVLVGYAALYLIMHLVRALRWALVVFPLSPRVTWKQVWISLNLGVPAAVFLPLRLGELVRPALIARAGVPLVSALAAAFVERVADFLVSLGIFCILLPTVPIASGSPMATVAEYAPWVFLGLLGTVCVVYAVRNVVHAFVVKLVSRWSPPLAERIDAQFQVLFQGLASLHRPARLGTFLLTSGLVWVLLGVANWWLAVSYLPELPLASGIFATSVLIFVILIPAGPAFIGTFESGFRLGLSPYGVDESSVAVIAVVGHLAQLVLLASIAASGIALSASGVRPRNRETPPEI